MLSVKIVGISGVGKSTLAKKIVSRYPGISSMSFGEYLLRYGCAAQKEWEKFLEAQKGTVVIVEHLEIGENDLLDIYRKENTKAIFLINPSVEEVIRRRKKDNVRERKIDREKIAEDLRKSKRRVTILSKKLVIPLVVVQDETIEQNLEYLGRLIARVERKRDLENDQAKLKLQIIDFDLEKEWNSCWFMEKLRRVVIKLVMEKLEQSDFLFDPQDLEHQILFYLTTFHPLKLRDEDIKLAVDEQYLVMRKRLLGAFRKDELYYLFRGVKNFYPDLNSEYRLRLIWQNNQLVAAGEGRRFEVEFRKVEDESIATLFTETFHYMHSKRSNGDTFALFFKGDRYPWAVETCENGIFARQYKRDSLLAFGADPDNTVELTRLYILPGSPLNAVSVLDGLIKRYYRKKAIEALFTCTMPAYSKTKATTVSGGLDRVLCVKSLKHFFTQCEIDSRLVWEIATRRGLEKKQNAEIKTTHRCFVLPPKVDVFSPIQSRMSLDCLLELKTKNKAIFFN